MPVQPLVLDMAFKDQVTQLRKMHSWTQQKLAEKAGVKVLQIRRYESGASQPTLEVIKRMAIAFSVTTDQLIFDGQERGPSEDLRLQFERISQFTSEEKKIVKALLEGLILKHEAKHLAQMSQ